MSRLLVTGAAGGLGQGLLDHLRPHFSLRLVDVLEQPTLYPQDDALTGDLSDPSFAALAVRGCDAILHLAAVHGLAIPFEATLDTNYRALIHLMDAACANNLRRVVFASSNHGWGFHPRSAAPLADTAPPRPDGWYAVSKIWGEAVMALYADAHGMSNTSLRIGNCGPDVPDERRRRMWISYRDLAALIVMSLGRSDPGHLAVFACGECPDPFFDTSGAKHLGFVARDHPDDHLVRADVALEPAPPGIAGQTIGGAYAAANFHADLKDLTQS